MSKLGILGGTFDPIHFGHIEMAKAAKTALGLDEVLLIPGGNPPHKDGAELTDARLRYEMTERAVAGISGLQACDYEVKKNTFSYTAETLEHLAAENPEDELFFILGADSLDYIERWHCPEVIFKLARLVVFGRDDFNSKQKAEALLKRFGGEIIYLSDDIPRISSTEIRKLCDMGLDISAFVPKAAEEFIKEKQLYRRYYSKLRAKVKRVLKADRFLHTERVIKTAVRMAEFFGVDQDKAYIAALLHDSAKNLPDKERLCGENQVELDAFERAHPALIHAKLGAYLAKAVYGIGDEEIINAIKWHTLGRPDMTDLEKIIFVADMAEEGRAFPGVELIRAAAVSNLDRAVLLCVEQTIKYNEKKGAEVHPAAYELREHFAKATKEV